MAGTSDVTHLQEGTVPGLAGAPLCYGAHVVEGIHLQIGVLLRGDQALLGGTKGEVVKDFREMEVNLLHGKVLHQGEVLLQGVDHLLGEAPLQDREKVVKMEMDHGGLGHLRDGGLDLEEGGCLHRDASLLVGPTSPTTDVGLCCLVGTLHREVGLHLGEDLLKGGGDTHQAGDFRSRYPGTGEP